VCEGECHSFAPLPDTENMWLGATSILVTTAVVQRRYDIPRITNHHDDGCTDKHYFE
jgi:hypothetical protein